MEYLGEPLSDADRLRIDAAASLTDGARAIEEIQRVLDPQCLVSIRINPESRISVDRAAAPARLVEQGWRAYLVKVRNEAGVTGVLTVESPQARPVYRRGTGLAMAPQSIRPADVTDRWLDLDTYGQKPMESGRLSRREKPCARAEKGKGHELVKLVGHQAPSKQATGHTY